MAGFRRDDHILSEENRDCLHKKCVCVRARACMHVHVRM